MDVNEDRLEDVLAKLEGVHNWSPRVISKLENSIRTAEDNELFRINPLFWASQKNVDEYEAVDLFLHAAKFGLFDMDWNVICPCCGKVMRSLRDLHGLQSRNICTVCFRKDLATLDDYVQITFTLSPSIRMLRFHQPDTLALDEYCFNYLYEPSARIAGALTPRDAMRIFQKHLSSFMPGQKIIIETEAIPGVLSCVEVFTQHSFGLLTSGEPLAEPQKLSVKLTEEGFEVPLPEIQPGEFSLGPFDYAGVFYPVHPGKVVIEFEHSADTLAALLVVYFPIEGLPADFQLPVGLDSESLQVGSAPDVQFSSPRLTAKRLFANQTFHDLFRAEVFRESEGFSIKDVTILFTDLKSSTQLYQQIGDLNAYALVREHYGILNNAVLSQHGAIVKTIGDAIMATFNDPVDAVAAGIEMLKELRLRNQTSQQGDLILKVGIHHGAAISVTLNDRIDYFGQTVNIASRVQGNAGGNEIFLTGDIFSSAGVQELLQNNHCQVEPVQIQLKGIEEIFEIFRVIPGD